MCSVASYGYGQLSWTVKFRVLYIYQFFYSWFNGVPWKTEPKAGLRYNPRAARLREKGNEAGTWWCRMPVQKTVPQGFLMEQEIGRIFLSSHSFYPFLVKVCPMGTNGVPFWIVTPSHLRQLPRRLHITSGSLSFYFSLGEDPEPQESARWR